MKLGNGVNRLEIKNLSVCYNEEHCLKDINLVLKTNEILGIIGPANSGKTSFLRVLNRLISQDKSVKITGEVLLDDQDILKTKKLTNLRKKVGMVFAMPNPLPMSIFDNVAYGPRMHGIKKRSKLDEIVENALKSAYLFDEVKDRLKQNALTLSGGQQQRLCIARSLAIEPEIILYDEPCSGLDPISTAKVEEAMFKLKEKYSQILVTNNTKQAARVCDRTAFFLMGELVECDTTQKIFTFPADKRTEDYITGRFG
jgi:phosphate transport system ATP-binding protein